MCTLKNLLKYGKLLTEKTNSTWLSRPMVTIVLMKVLGHIPAVQAAVSIIQIITLSETKIKKNMGSHNCFIFLFCYFFYNLNRY